MTTVNNITKKMLVTVCVHNKMQNKLILLLYDSFISNVGYED